MANEEERAKILAEYMATADQDDDDDSEAELEDDSSDDGSDSYEDSDDDDDEDGDSDLVVLNGTLSNTEEGRLLFSGIWSSSSGGGDDSRPDKKNKFKLKSKEALSHFNLCHPLSTVCESNSEPKQQNSYFLPQSQSETRTILMDGFFMTDNNSNGNDELYRKIRERDVELVFSVSRKDSTNLQTTTGENVVCYCVHGAGCNEYGNFSLHGTYCPKEETTKEEGEDHQSLILQKRYANLSTTTTIKRKSRPYEDDGGTSEDDIQDGEGADYEELIGLHQDAEITVEELRRKYYGTTTNGDDDVTNERPAEENGAKQTKGVAKKRFKKEDTEEDDENNDCGF